MDVVSCVHSDITEVLQSCWLAVMTSDQGGKHSRVLQVLVKVENLAWMHYVHLVVVISHPFEKDCF